MMRNGLFGIAGGTLGARAPFVLLALLLLAGCDTPPERNRFAAITYEHLPAIAFDVAHLEVASRYRPSLAPPDVDHLFPTTPEAAALQWARDRLKPVGGARTLRYSVVDAAVTEVPLGEKSGLEGLLTTEQTERYEGSLAVELEIVSGRGEMQAHASVRAIRSITVAENASLAERERIWFDLTENLMNDLNAQLEKTIGEVFGRFLRT